MRSSGKSWKFDCTARPFSMLIRAALDRSVERGALHLVLGADRVDDLAAHVGGDPHLVDLERAARCDRHLHDLGEVAHVAVVERGAHSRSRR